MFEGTLEVECSLSFFVVDGKHQPPRSSVVYDSFEVIVHVFCISFCLSLFIELL